MIRSCNEKIGGAGYSFKAMEDFNECVEKIDIKDVPAQGIFLTWCNLHDDGSKIYCKLDRVMANEGWFSIFKHTEVVFDLVGVSDHSPAITKMKEVNPGPKPFKYQQFYMKHPIFNKKMEKVWEA